MDVTLEGVWHEFAEKLRRFIRRRVPDPHAAEDILQEAFLKISRHRERLADVDHLQAWLYRIARNAVIDHHRTRKETVELPATLAGGREPDAGEIEGLKAALRRMVGGLPGIYREALLLTEFDGLTQKELAGRLGIAIASARSRVQRGRARLKKMLLDCCRFELDRRGGVIDCQPRRAGDCPECP